MGSQGALKGGALAGPLVEAVHAALRCLSWVLRGMTAFEANVSWLR